MSVTTRLSLPYIAPQQAQKQVSYNAAMALLDQLVQPTVKSRTTATPPASPVSGEDFIVPSGGTGAWSGKDLRLARWSNGTWSFLTPGPGWVAYVIDAAELVVWDGASWTPLVPQGATLAKFGIHTSADLTNRLAVAADASLFTHDGTSHRLKINKASAADTASLLLQTNSSGRAEIGLAGDDALHLKVSANGSSWTEALTIAPATGLVSLPIGQLAFPATANPSSSTTTLDDYREGTWTPTLAFGGASTGITYGTPTAGRFTRIGRTVILSGIITLTSKGSATGSATIGGLPYSSLSDSIPAAVCIGAFSGLTGLTGTPIASIAAGTSRITLSQTSTGSASAISNGSFTNAAALQFTATYES